MSGDAVRSGPDVVKTRADAPAGFFGFEAAGLAWLGSAGAVRVAAVLDHDRNHIRLERIVTAPATHAAAERFGRDLARMHAAGAAGFGAPPEGWDGPGWIGRQRQDFGSYDSWGAFYAELRVLPFARAARDLGTLPATGAAAVDRACERLAAGDFDDDRPPERIHGDLWAGNVLYDATGAVLIDPAAHGGSGRTDLAMLALFGTEHLGRVQAAYAEAARLPADWLELTGLHQLHPLLVHAVSHGRSYGAEAARIAQRY